MLHRKSRGLYCRVYYNKKIKDYVFFIKKQRKSVFLVELGKNFIKNIFFKKKKINYFH